MFNKDAFLVILCLTSAFVQIIAAQEQCQTCMKNQAYCVNEKSYYLCPNPKNPSRNILQTCAEDEICTSGANICVKSDEVVAPITSPCSSSCGKCPSDSTKKFTCVGKRQFTLCSGSEQTTILGSCSNDQICSMDSFLADGDICIPECVAAYFGYEPTCTTDENLTTTTTTQAPTAAPNQASLQLQCQKASENHQNALFFRIRNADDASCRSFIYCEPTAKGIDAILILCKTGYYDSSTGGCVPNKPKSCTVQL